jgi:hypothetical protein
VPIFVLSLLQAASSGVSKEIHNSSLAHYFYFLIIGALESAGVPQAAHARYIAFGTHLGWFIRTSGTSFAISERQFKKFCDDYSNDWTLTNSDDMAKVLTKARILEKNGDVYCFTYQYAYYYFLGKYASLFIDREDVKEYLSYCIENLYVRECANTLLFLAHHSENSVVLDAVTAALQAHLVPGSPVTFSKADVARVASLMSSAPALVYQIKDPVETRKELHAYQDRNDSGEDGLLDQPKGTGKRKDFIEELISLSKTLEILGILLTNQFSSLSREKKNSSIQLMFESSLKVINSFYSFFSENPERLIQDLTKNIRARISTLDADKAEAGVRRAIAWLLRLISTGWVIKAGQHVGSPDLEDNVAQVVEANPTLAFRLVQIAQMLNRPGALPQATLTSIVKGQEDNPCVMAVLQILVLNRLYMYETHHEDRHWAIATFQLSSSTNTLALVKKSDRGGQKPA